MHPIHFDLLLTSEGWRRDVTVAVAGGRVSALVPGRSPGAPSHRIGVPGLPNLHSHAFQRGMAGLTETRGAGPDSFWSWRDVMYRFALAMTPDDVEAVASELYVEMLEAGFTRVGEFHYLHHAPDGHPYDDVAEMGTRIAAAAGTAGIGLTLLPVFYARAGFDGAPAGGGQRRFACDLDRYAALLAGSERAIAGLDGANLGVAPHSLRAAAPGELGAVAAMAGGRPVHIHVAEQVKEVEDCMAQRGARPVAWLLDHAPVDAHWCLIHATHMTDAECAALAARGAVAGLCPVTEANLGDGIFDAPRFRDAGGRFGVGSDSNVAIDAAGELRQLEYSQRLARRARNVLAPPGGSTGEALFTAALAGGAAALGQAGAGLAAGAPADIVSLDADHPALAGHGPATVLDAWVFGAGTALVDAVWTRGIQQVAGGRHRHRDVVRRRFAASMARLAG
ncbi:formimidoylglutamate deiminase [Lichenibacterium ramalinae]|uniref:Formimidoylglutamate deiminase n=1 Tax=Lichenibacterium ramalinae TaxID=2316527 RepID=A0A4Q2REM9_9HYPH|nr:formimidoylglutamate deiminase [Lichenibacterium ramalinae]RYB06030.1 formimidoylglutamate deiminase [Lichenibacterium ramalinae]